MPNKQRYQYIIFIEMLTENPFCLFSTSFHIPLQFVRHLAETLSRIR